MTTDLFKTAFQEYLNIGTNRQFDTDNFPLFVKAKETVRIPMRTICIVQPGYESHL